MANWLSHLGWSRITTHAIEWLCLLNTYQYNACTTSMIIILSETFQEEGFVEMVWITPFSWPLHDTLHVNEHQISAPCTCTIHCPLHLPHPACKWAPNLCTLHLHNTQSSTPMRVVSCMHGVPLSRDRMGLNGRPYTMGPVSGMNRVPLSRTFMWLNMNCCC